MKKQIAVALKSILIITPLLILACPPCSITYTGVTFQVESILTSYSLTSLAPSVGCIDGDEIKLIGEQIGDSTAVWTNHDLSQFSNKILVFSISLKDSAGRQNNFFLDTIRLQKNNVIDYSISLGHSIKRSNKLLPQKYYPIGDITKNESDTMSTVYSYSSTLCY